MNPMQETSDAIRPIIDAVRNEGPVDAILLAQQINEALLSAQGEVAMLRRSAVRQLRGEGWTLREIGEAVGLTTSRVAQLEAGMSRHDK